MSAGGGSNSGGGSGNYFKHRCKNHYTENCGNWVWVANTACTACIVLLSPVSHSLPPWC